MLEAIGQLAVLFLIEGGHGEEGVDFVDFVFCEAEVRGGEDTFDLGGAAIDYGNSSLYLNFLSYNPIGTNSYNSQNIWHEDAVAASRLGTAAGLPAR